MADFHPLPPPLPEDITDGPERDQAFTPTNDAIWGEGGWMKCYECPRDRKGNPIYHSKLAHPSERLLRAAGYPLTNDGRDDADHG